MITIELGNILKKTKVSFYDSIKEMPSDRYNELQKMFYYTIGVGSEVKDFNNHFSKLISYISNNKNDNAIQEMKNLYNCYYNAINGISPYALCMMAMIKDVDGEEYLGDSLEDHQEKVMFLSKKGLKHGQVVDVVEDVKKNFIQNLDATFLADIAVQEMKTYYQR